MELSNACAGNVFRILERSDAHATSISRVVIAADLGVLTVGHTDGTVTLWRLDDAVDAVHVLEHTHTDLISSVDVSAEGSVVCAGSDDGKLSLWNAEDGSLAGVIPVSTRPLVCVGTSADCWMVCVQARRDKPQLWDTRSRKLVHRLDTGHISAVTHVAVTHDGSKVFTVSSDRMVGSRHTPSLLAPVSQA